MELTAGLVATQNIVKNDEMVVVPSESALVTTTDQLCPFPEWVSKDFWASSPWWVPHGEAGVGYDNVGHPVYVVVVGMLLLLL